MMIGHISDTHLGACAGSEPEREGDHYRAFEEAIDLFIREHVDLVIHSGDILDEPRPYGTAMKILVEGVRRLREHGIQFLFTLGEHDISNVPSTPHPLILQLEGLGAYIGTGKPYEVGGATVIGLHKYKRVERRHLLGRLEEIGRGASSLAGKRVLVLHQGVKEAFGPGAELSISEIPAGFDYYAMGHIHKRYERGLGDGVIAFPGATHWVNVDDPDECGVYLVDLSGDQASVEWVRLQNVRPKMRLRLNASEAKDRIEELANKSFHMKPYLLLEIVVDKPLDVKEVEKKLGGGFIIKTIKLIPAPAEGRTYSSRPEINLDEELRRLALEVIGDEGVVDFALGELLQHLSSGNLSDAKEAVWRFWRAWSGGGGEGDRQG